MTDYIGFVLVCTEPGHERDVYKNILTLEDARWAYLLTGYYNIIAKVEVPDFNAAIKLITNKIKPIPGVTDTKLISTVKRKGMPSFVRGTEPTLEARTETLAPAA